MYIYNILGDGHFSSVSETQLFEASFPRLQSLGGPRAQVTEHLQSLAGRMWKVNHCVSANTLDGISIADLKFWAMSQSPCLPLIASGEKQTILKVVSLVCRRVSDWGELIYHLEGPVVKGRELRSGSFLSPHWL